MADDQFMVEGMDAKTRTSRQAEEEILDIIFQLWSHAQLWRNTFAAHWEEVAELILPTSRNTFYYGNFNWPGQKKTDRQVDANGMLALHRFGAICDSLLTPRNQMWHGLAAPSVLTTSNIDLNRDMAKDRDTRLWFEYATRLLFKQRYAPIANFSAQNQNSYESLGAFGTAGMFIDQAVSEANVPLRAWRYKSIPLGELFLLENHQGLINGMIRWFRLTAAQAAQKWGNDMIPEQMKGSLEKHSLEQFDFLHVVMPRRDFDPMRLDAKGKPFASYYVSIEGRKLMAEGGYTSFPLAASRYTQTPGEVYGRSPAMMVLPALKTLNAEKRTFLKQGHRAADPVLLTADDGLVDISLRPGALNKGGVNPDGKPLIQVLPTGEIQISKEMMDEEKALINDAFLVSLFQILTETPQMSATEVIERTNEKGILLAPTMGRQQSEYLGPLIHRELDLAMQLKMLPPMPPMLREAQGEYEVVYTSPLSRAARAQEAAGFMRTLETANQVAQATGDSSVYDPFAFDRAIPDIADIQGTPTKWMATPQEIQAKQQSRARQAQAQQQIQAAPAQAAMMKAQAAQAKAGMGQGAPQQGQPTSDQGQAPGG